MIKSKKEYKEFLKADCEMTGIDKFSWISKYIDKRYKFYKSLRKTEYLINCKKGYLWRYIIKLSIYRHNALCIKLGWTIPPNVFGKGLAIVHHGTIVVSGDSRIGDNCRIHVCVNIGNALAKGIDGAPIIGNNVYIGPGAKLFGGIRLGDNLAIGANAVVNESFPMGNCTIAGVPAIVISNNDSKKLY
ncbi:MAG: serine acetyltransferase [Bacilli bacterium]